MGSTLAPGLLKTILRLYPRAARLKAARKKRARPVRPSRKVELWYRVELRRIVEQCRQAGEDIVAGMRPHWPGPVTSDSVAPGLDSLLRLAAARFGNIAAVAERLAALAVQKSLAETDERLAKAMMDAVSVDISSYLEPGGDIAKAMRVATVANVDLIKSIPAQYLDKVGAAVEKAFAEGKRWEDLAKDVKRIGDVTDKRARLIARDQTSKMNAAFNAVRQPALGIRRYTWSTSHDERVRRSHGALNGTTQEWAHPPTVDGEPAHPGEPVNCRCVPIPKIELEDLAPDGGAFQEAA